MMGVSLQLILTGVNDLGSMLFVWPMQTSRTLEFEKEARGEEKRSSGFGLSRRLEKSRDLRISARAPI